MKNIGLNEIRKEFFDFFKEKNHLILPSFSLVPKDDKSLLLINAGMAPMKPYFTGLKTPPGKRVVTCQKCVRTVDIENVGKTDRHGTFFEMLGNFSFGDYFKEDAIKWAWEFITERMEVSKELIWVSIYKDDEESYKIWNEKINVPEDRIVRLDKEDNFWELELGPCGPCSEIYIDRGEEYGCGKPDCKPGCECDRYVEVWNLVFSQYDKDENGNYNLLPKPNIDTGMGLERMAMVMENAKNIFEVKQINEVLKEVERVSKVSYGKDSEKDKSIRVITDHARAITFMVSDGILPSNEGRGYVLRRLIRRASRHGKLLNIQGKFLSKIAEKVIELWKEQYPEIEKEKNRIFRIIDGEEEKFYETINQGLEILDQYISDMRSENKNILDGKKAFKLYDTYGFPFDLTKEILKERGYTADEIQFNREMEEQRERARSARGGSENNIWGTGDFSLKIEGDKTVFKGYETFTSPGVVEKIIKGNEFVGSLHDGEEGIVVLNQTPFYGEGGGQVGDTGILSKDGFESFVLNTKKDKEGHIFHYIKVKKGVLNVGDDLTAEVDEKRRKDIMRNHSATHLLHRALKNVLGEHVNQAGSLVLPDRLRFDFTHFESISKEQLAKIEEIVNEKIFEGLKVDTAVTSYDESKKMKAVALFEDKYSDKVRVVQMGSYTTELCGGTHVRNTNDIGIFKILNETSIASGIRRIEAITGRSVYQYLKELDEEIDNIANIVKGNRNNITERIKGIVEENRQKDKEVEKLMGKMALSLKDDIIKNSHEIKGINVLTYYIENMDINSLRNLGDEIKNSIGSGVIVLASSLDGKISFVSMVTKDLIDKGLHAGKIIKEVSQCTGGGGGGRPDMAQAGGKDINKVNQALNLVYDIIEKQLK